MLKKIAVIGDGGWGTTVAILLAKNGAAVSLWSRFPEYATLLNESRINQKFLPGVHIPDAIDIICDDALAKVEPDLVIFAVPTPFLRAVAGEVAGWLPAHAAILSVSKGIESETMLRGSEIITEVIGDRRIAVLSGPSHAEEVARGVFTLVSVASDDAQLAKAIQERFRCENFRVYTCPDVVGVELGGAIKNVIGVAAGMCDGLGYGDNTKSALLTRAIAEMARLGVAMGARVETFYGLSGMGDLITTAVSPYGRNRSAGEQLGKGKTVKDIIESTEMVAEGILTTQAAFLLAKRYHVPMPITEAIHGVMYEGWDPREAAQQLMTRDPGPE